MSAPEQIKLAPHDAVVLSANQHGCLLRKCDYLVACDNKPGRRYVSPKGLVDLREFHTPIISPRESMADFRIFNVPVNSSGVMAAWAAWLMGCSPIMLAGMDLYLGKTTYFHSPSAVSTGRHLPSGAHLAKWGLLKEKTGGSIMLRPLGGPLIGLFPAYSIDEQKLALPTREFLLKMAQGALVKMKATGKIVEVTPVEMHRGLRRGDLARI